MIVLKTDSLNICNSESYTEVQSKEKPQGVINSLNASVILPAEKG